MTRRAGRSPASLPAPLQTNRGQQTQLPCGPRATPGDVAWRPATEYSRESNSGQMGALAGLRFTKGVWYVRSRF
jgi:hypothetical protein